MMNKKESNNKIYTQINASKCFYMKKKSCRLKLQLGYQKAKSLTIKDEWRVAGVFKD